MPPIMPSCSQFLETEMQEGRRDDETRAARSDNHIEPAIPLARTKTRREMLDPERAAEASGGIV